ncbi:hypothetical protein NMY22_g3541 [Coprinellus aureogranulatus]|nr:hypothetical protein NMY22_g3541 [Coprinellus aureogranulatus]
MALDSIPQEILEHVGFFLATDQACGPPSALVPFLLTNRQIYGRLSPSVNPHFYALIFAHKFDVKTAKRRLGETRVSSVAMTQELQRRFAVLRRIRSKKDCLADPSSTDQCIDDILATAYLMMLENEGKNKQQLLGYADIGQWIKDYLLHDKGASLTRQQLQSGGYPLPTTRASLAMWLFWFFMRPGAPLQALHGDKCSITADQYANKMSGLEIPLTVLKTLAFSAHLYDLTNIPWFEYSPSQPRQPATVVTWYSQPLPLTPPPMAVPAILSFLALVNKRKSVPITPSDPSISSPPVDEWGAEWGRAVSSGLKHNEVADCFNFGSIDGVWEGFFTYTEFTAYAAMLSGASPQQIQNSIIGRHQQTWKLREWHLVQPDGAEIQPLSPGDPLRSFFIEGTRLTETEVGLAAQDPGSESPLLYTRAGTKHGKIVDVIITGEGHSAWGQFSLTGRVRPCDGFISLSKDYVSFCFRSQAIANRRLATDSTRRLTMTEESGYTEATWWAMPMAILSGGGETL